MTHAPALSVPARVELRPRRTAATRPNPTIASGLSEARRSQNRSEVGTVSQLRCECDAAGCRELCPTIADSHRGMLDRFIVTPAHLGAATVVRAADRFFIVELGRAGWH